MIDQVRGYLGDLLGVPASGIRIVVVNGGVSVRSKLVCLCWVGDEAEPGYVAKFPRYPMYNYRVETEYRALQDLQPYLPEGPIEASRPVGTTSINGLQVTVETMVRGRLLRAYLREHQQAYQEEFRNLEPLVQWLGELQRRSARPASGEQLQELVFHPLGTAPGELNFTDAERAAWERLAEEATQLSTRFELPVVLNHNDCGTTNIMVDGAGRFTGLIDWESGAFGIPCLDPFYFMSRFAFESRDLGRGDLYKGYREIYFGQNSGEDALDPRLARTWLADYCRQVGVAPEWLPVLFGLCWAMHAHNEKRHVLGLLSEGSLILGKPASVSQATTDVQDVQKGHFRSLLRIYLENHAQFQGGPALSLGRQ